jgi:hypothetical protein
MEHKASTIFVKGGIIAADVADIGCKLLAGKLEEII